MAPPLRRDARAGHDRRRPLGGPIVDPSADGTFPVADGPEPTPAQQAAHRLREAIIRGHFTPGERLREEELASRLQVGYGTVRDVLSLVEHEHLVELRPNRGAVVAHLTEQDLEEVYSLRIALERLAARRAATRATDGDLDEVRVMLREFESALETHVDEHTAAELDLRFHDAIYRAARHRRLWAAWSALRPQVRMFLLRRNIVNPDWRRMTLTGHQEILDKLRARDAKAAEERIARHVAIAYDRIRAESAKREATN